MNFYAVVYYLGWIMEIMGVTLLIPSGVGLYYHEKAWLYYFLVSVSSLIFGTIIVIKKPKYKAFYTKEGFVTVAAAWILMSFIGCLPFYFSGEIPSFIDALFESASGFTTTGSTIMMRVSTLSHAALFWRSFSHWIGGMGVLVFLLAILPAYNNGTMQLMKAESPGPSVGKIVPKIRETALILYLIYFAMTVLETLFLLMGGMPWFDAINTALATAGTGGFAIRNNSIAFYHSAYIEVVITVFMYLFGVNFVVYYNILIRKFKDILHNEELRTYLIIIASSIILITYNLSSTPMYTGHLGAAVKDASFNVATVMSTTGFGTVDFDMWPQFSKCILFVLMFVGASAGSTGGGFKVSRLLILLKSSFSEVSSFIHPRSVRAVTLDKKKVDKKIISQTKSYFAIYSIIIIISIILVSIDGYDMITTISSVVSAINNIGPGFNLVGPTGNFALFSPFAKAVLIFDMLAGRLELFPILVIFSPTTFKDAFGAVKRRKIHGSTKKLSF